MLREDQELHATNLERFKSERQIAFDKLQASLAELEVLKARISEEKIAAEVARENARREATMANEVKRMRLYLDVVHRNNDDDGIPIKIEEGYDEFSEVPEAPTCFFGVNEELTLLTPSSRKIYLAYCPKHTALKEATRRYFAMVVTTRQGRARVRAALDLLKTVSRMIQEVNFLFQNNRVKSVPAWSFWVDLVVVFTRSIENAVEEQKAIAPERIEDVRQKLLIKFAIVRKTIAKKREEKAIAEDFLDFCRGHESKYH
jgi:hypothetical protein